MPYATAGDGTTLYYKDWGEGPPVVLLHGWLLQADCWDDVAYALVEAGHRVIAYDRRGFGRSGQPWDGYDYDTLSDDLAAVIASAGIDRFAAVGYSMGGGEVARYMTRHGGKGVDKAALVSAVVPGLFKSAVNPYGMDGETLDRIKDAILRDRPKFLAESMPAVYGIDAAPGAAGSDLVAWSCAMGMQASLRATIACLDAWARTDFTPDLAALAVPTLIVHGTGDNNLPAAISSHRTARIVPQARLLEYEGAPHGLYATHKERLARDLIAFLKPA